ncbi:MAG TPA: glycosyltransferase family 2 protein [Pyrinomonadaceae bacterium]|nr:glycosyltransferase family 2 protein [Pyrinomonadaceae bacterium]
MKTTILISALWFVAFAWLVISVLTVRSLSRQKGLSATTNLRLTANDAPLVSILVPVRNEQERVLEPCMRSILAQDYDNFEVIAVNDRSTDKTGAILETLAKSDEAFRSICGLRINISVGFGSGIRDVV